MKIRKTVTELNKNEIGHNHLSLRERRWKLSLMKMGIWNKAALIFFLLADFISLAVLKVRSILADEAGTSITSLAMGASAGNLYSFNFHYCNGLNDK
jgi:hypothetical protein